MKIFFTLINPKASIGLGFQNTGKCLRVIVLLLTLFYNAIDGANLYGQVYYSQLDPSWSSIRMGTYNVHDCSIGGCGCLISSISMHYNGTLNPANFNYSLNLEHGYNDGASYIWNKIIPYPLQYDGLDPYQNNYSYLDSKLSSGKKVIVQVLRNGHEHWVLIRYRSGNSGNPSSYFIYDPGDGTVNRSKTLAAYGNFYRTATFNLCTGNPTPSGLAAYIKTSTTAVIEFTACASSYNIQVKRMLSGNISNYTVSTFPIYLTNLVPGESFSVSIKGFNGGSWTPYSSWYTFTLPLYRTANQDSIDDLLLDYEATDYISDATASIDNYGQEHTLSFQNPVKPMASFELRSLLSTESVELYDLQGKFLNSYLPSESVIAPDQVGVFLIKVKFIDGRVAIQKLVVAE